MADASPVRDEVRPLACSVNDVDLGDEQPTQHEIGNRTYIVAQVEPLDVDGVRTTEVGTALWLLGVSVPTQWEGRPVGAAFDAGAALESRR